MVLPALHAELPPEEVLLLELLLLEEELLELLVVLPDEVEDPLEGMEHSLTDFEGIGSEPKVATLHTKEPFNTL